MFKLGWGADASNHELEIAAFGEVRRNGVVERLAGLVDDLETLAGAGPGRRQQLLERLWANLAGAACGGEYAAGCHAAQCQRIQAGVGAGGGEAILLALGEAGRVEDHQAELTPLI